MNSLQPKWRAVWVQVTAICRPDVGFVNVCLPFRCMWPYLATTTCRHEGDSYLCCNTEFNLQKNIQGGARNVVPFYHPIKIVTSQYRCCKRASEFCNSWKNAIDVTRL